MNISKTIAFTIATFLVIPVAFAGSPKGNNKLSNKQKVQKMLDRFDQNGDRMLDANELEAVIEFRRKRKAKRKARRQQVLQRFDTNGDGRLDKNERRAAKKARANMRFDRLLQRFDQNGDGAIAWTEVQAVPPKAGAPGQGKRGKRIGKLFHRADTNNDGVLTRGEFKQAVKKMRGKRGGPGHRGGHGGGPGANR